MFLCHIDVCLSPSFPLSLRSMKISRGEEKRKEGREGMEERKEGGKKGRNCGEVNMK